MKRSLLAIWRTNGPRRIYPWTLTSYEQLLTQKRDELERIVHALGGAVNERMQEGLGVASSFAADDFRQDVEHQLMKWRSELSAEQIEVILKVVDAFDLGFYTDDALPDLEQLLRYQKPSVRPASA